MLRWSMRHRWVIVTISVATFLSTGLLFKFLGVDFLPQDDQSEFEVTVRMPAGSSLAGTDQLMRQVEADLRRLPGVKNLLTQIGSDPRQQVDRGTILVAHPEKALLDHWHLSAGEWTSDRLAEMRYQNMKVVIQSRLRDYAARFKRPRLDRAVERWLQLAEECDAGDVIL
jgi:multidrug efflux pump subunit AcrB